MEKKIEFIYCGNGQCIVRSEVSPIEIGLKIRPIVPETINGTDGTDTFQLVVETRTIEKPPLVVLKVAIYDDSGPQVWGSECPELIPCYRFARWAGYKNLEALLVDAIDQWPNIRDDIYSDLMY
jgi:hypothetical protein